MVRAFQRVLGPQGTLLVPAFTYSFRNRPNTPPLDRRNSPGSRTGLFAETVRTHPSAHRSGHPTHSVAAIGGRAKEFTDGHERISALGVGSPMHKAAEAGGHILLIGVTHNRNSSIHIGEVLAGVPYSTVHFCEDWGRTGRIVGTTGRVEEIPLHPEIPGCSRGFDAIDPYLRAGGVIVQGRIGNAATMFMKGLDLLAVVRDVLMESPALLLCDNLDCEACTRRKAVAAAATVWKNERGV